MADFQERVTFCRDSSRKAQFVCYFSLTSGREKELTLTSLHLLLLALIASIQLQSVLSWQSPT